MSKLLNKTIKLLQETDIPLNTIVRETNLTYPWLTRLRGQYDAKASPAVDKIETLYEFLSGKQLEV